MLREDTGGISGFVDYCQWLIFLLRSNVPIYSLTQMDECWVTALPSAPGGTASNVSKPDLWWSLNVLYLRLK